MIGTERHMRDGSMLLSLCKSMTWEDSGGTDEAVHPEPLVKITYTIQGIVFDWVVDFLCIPVVKLDQF